tara:strand:+ start:11316 stop:11585 length:270 start_codon:yes stop_codon:yes gene_type:complete
MVVMLARDENSAIKVAEFSGFELVFFDEGVCLSNDRFRGSKNIREQSDVAYYDRAADLGKDFKYSLVSKPRMSEFRGHTLYEGKVHFYD